MIDIYLVCRSSFIMRGSSQPADVKALQKLLFKTLVRKLRISEYFYLKNYQNL